MKRVAGCLQLHNVESGLLVRRLFFRQRLSSVWKSCTNSGVTLVFRSCSIIRFIGCGTGIREYMLATMKDTSIIAQR